MKNPRILRHLVGWPILLFFLYCAPWFLYFRSHSQIKSLDDPFAPSGAQSRISLERSISSVYGPMRRIDERITLNRTKRRIRRGIQGSWITSEQGATGFRLELDIDQQSVSVVAANGFHELEEKQYPISEYEGESWAPYIETAIGRIHFNPIENPSAPDRPLELYVRVYRDAIGDDIEDRFRLRRRNN